MGQLQIIKCVGGECFAACRVPECYESVDWMRELRAYVKNGCTVEIIESGTGKTFGNCQCGAKSKSCKLKEKKSQLQLL